jgi:hypothetical protein
MAVMTQIERLGVISQTERLTVITQKRRLAIMSQTDMSQTEGYESDRRLGL